MTGSMTSRRTSASTRPASEVKPERSAKSTVTRRRSPPTACVSTSRAATRRDTSPNTPSPPPRSDSPRTTGSEPAAGARNPHSPQNCCSSRFARPQTPHVQLAITDCDQSTPPTASLRSARRSARERRSVPTRGAPPAWSSLPAARMRCTSGGRGRRRRPNGCVASTV